MELIVTDQPVTALTNAERSARYRATHKDARNAEQRQRRADSQEARLQNNEARYLSRRFVGVDGEGINVRSGKRKGQHDYVLLAVSGKPPILSKDGLHTLPILNYLWESLSPEDNNVIYGGSYDFNCWVRDFPESVLRELYSGRRVRFGAYTLKWMRGKSFSIKRGEKVVTIYDVVSFFQKPFLNACDEYLGEYEGREVIAREKARRGDFTWRQINRIGSYNSLELELLERLCNELRARLNAVGLRPRRWIGPGAIAAALFEREHVREHMSRDIPEAVGVASRYAYAGGRFECLQYGIVRRNAYEYDVNSAYPKALSLVPSLKDGVWTHRNSRNSKIDRDAFALYRIRWNQTNREALTIPGPLHVRAANGTISYPMQGENWVWAPEAGNLAEYAELTGLDYEVMESWTMTPATSHKPFGFVPALYERRKALKAAGDGAHIGIKLALNSMYGKCAQQVGWNKKDGLPPTYHQLEWAGYVTSWCRAQVLKAAMQNLHAVIAFETDALFTSEPLSLNVSDRLGEFEQTEFRSLTYVQSGLYFGTEVVKRKEITAGYSVECWGEVAKSRGADRGEVARGPVEDAMRAGRDYLVKLTRFMGAGIALARNVVRSEWRTWRTEPKVLHLSPMGKRAPLSQTLADGWNETYCPVRGGMSHPFPIEWINPDPNMTELAELRESEVQWDE